MGSLGDESSSGNTTELGEEEGACLCSTHDQVWETTGVDTGGETVQGALYPKQGLGGAGAKRRKVAVKPGSVGAWVTKVEGPEVAARLTGHQGWGLQGEVRRWMLRLIWSRYADTPLRGLRRAITFGCKSLTPGGKRQAQ